MLFARRQSMPFQRAQVNTWANNPLLQQKGPMLPQQAMPQWQNPLLRFNGMNFGGQRMNPSIFNNPLLGFGGGRSWL
jgi:hypothetical protein